MAKTAQAGEGRIPALLEIGKDLADHIVQAIGRFGVAYSGLSSHAFCDIRLLHSALTVSGEYLNVGPLVPTPSHNQLKNKGLFESKKISNKCER
jgi:hypothetical protein